MKIRIWILLLSLWANSALALSCGPGPDPAYVRCDTQGCQPIFAVKREISGVLCNKSPSGFYDQPEFQSIISNFQKEGLLGKEVGLFEIALSTRCRLKNRFQEERSKKELELSHYSSESRGEKLRFYDELIARQQASCLTSKIAKIQTDNIDHTIRDLKWTWHIKIWKSYLVEPGLFLILLAFLEATRHLTKRKKPLIFGALAQLAIIFSVLWIVLLILASWVPARWFLYPIFLITYGTIAPRLTRLSNSDNMII